jgi:hypothetical protein
VLVGTLVAVGDSALVIRPRLIRPPEVEMEVSVPTSLIQRFEISRGKSRGQGAKFGAIVGLGGGMLIGFFLGEELEDCTPGEGDLFCFGPAFHVAAGGILGLASGIVIGAIVGRGDRWEEEPVPVRVGIVPASGGAFRVAASLAF